MTIIGQGSRFRVQGSGFRVGRLALSIFFEIVDLPARALISICFFNNLFFLYISDLAWLGSLTVNREPWNFEPE
jgi:hypothetical protein